MKAHVIHDKSGKIRSIVLQTSEIEGELEIQPVEKKDLVTVVDLSDLFPEAATGVTGASSSSSDDRRHFIAKSIREQFRIDTKKKTLVRSKGR